MLSVDMKENRNRTIDLTTHSGEIVTEFLKRCYGLPEDKKLFSAEIIIELIKFSRFLMCKQAELFYLKTLQNFIGVDTTACIKIAAEINDPGLTSACASYVHTNITDVSNDSLTKLSLSEFEFITDKLTMNNFDWFITHYRFYRKQDMPREKKIAKFAWIRYHLFSKSELEMILRLKLAQIQFDDLHIKFITVLSGMQTRTTSDAKIKELTTEDLSE
jgi:hypothetical protein